MNIKIDLWLQDYVQEFLETLVREKVTKELGFLPYSGDRIDTSFSVFHGCITISWVHRDQWGCEKNRSCESFTVGEDLRLIISKDDSEE